MHKEGCYTVKFILKVSKESRKGGYTQPEMERSLVYSMMNTPLISASVRHSAATKAIELSLSPNGCKLGCVAYLLFCIA